MEKVFKFPSDHLPIGAEFSFKDDKEKIKIVSWNCLNKNFMKWIIKNEQGLNNSIITKSHNNYSSNKCLIDKREEWIIRIIKIWMDNKFHIICLQEVSKDLYNELLGFDDKYKIISSNENKKDMQLIMYNRKSGIGMLGISIYSYPNEKHKKIINLTLFTKYIVFTIINSHVPFKNMKTFSDYIVKENKISTFPIICCGDFNKSSEEIKDYIFSDYYVNSNNQITHIRAKKCSNKDKIQQFDFIINNKSNFIKSAKPISIKELGIEKVHKILIDTKDNIYKINQY